MADAVFDLALAKRFTDSQELVLVDVTASDLLLIHNATTGAVYRIQAGTLASFINSAISSSDILDALNAPNGVATLDSGGKVPAAQLPAYVDDVLEYASTASFPATGESGKIYVALNTNLTYRWSGSAYVEISQSLALGETASTAYRGDRGKTAYDHSQSTGNPHGTSKADVGLGNVDNTSDANKPVSTATQTALNAKEPTINAGTSSQYWRGDKSWQTLNKSAVGLGNVDNTSDANKPVSTAQQTALDLKANKAQEAWKVPVFAGSWANFSATGYEQVGFLKDEFGFVCLQGLVKSGSGLIFTLPVGYRPAEQKIFAINASGSFGDLRIDTDGAVRLNAGSNTYVSLAGIRFQAAANTYETGLTAEYDMTTFSSAATLVDVSGNGYNATFNAAPTKIAAGLQFGSGGGFRASTGFVRAQDVSGFIVLRKTDVNNDRNGMALSNWGDFKGGLIWTPGAANAKSWGWQQGSTGTNASAASLNTWVLLYFYIDSSNNSQLMNLTTGQSSSVVNGGVASPWAWAIAGGREIDGSGTFRTSFDYVDGEIAYISLYNKVLSSTERSAAQAFIQGKMAGRSITV